jgi:peptidoglycan/LPS O-acetylase OafA/YrhL
VTERRLESVDGLRAIAVLAVVAHHASLLPFAYGARGVDLFFVISGFCLSLPTLRRLQAGEPFRFDRLRFAVGRIERIVPPYYAALLLFGVLSLTSFGLPSVRAPAAPYEWLTDALFLTSMAPAYNASFWTLGIEARWYVFFPAILALFARSKPLFAVAGIGFYALFAAQSALVDAGTLPCFMLGIVAADIHARGRSQSIWFVMLFAVTLIAALFFDRGENAGDPLWHAAAFFCVLAGIGRLERITSWRPLASVGVASYSIYLVHQPVLLWLTRYPIPWPVCAALSVGAGFAFWRAVEVPALAWRARAKERYVARSKSRTSATNCSS